MATLAAGSSVNLAIGFGSTVQIDTSAATNISGRWYFTPSDAAVDDDTGTARSFGPLPYKDTIGPFVYPGTLTIENYANSPAALTYTLMDGPAYTATLTSINTTTLLPSGAVNSTPLTIGGTGAKTISTTSAAINITATTGTIAIGPTTTGALNLTRLNSIGVQNTDASGTPGNATINTARGRAAFAAAGSAVVVTNSLVTAASTVLVSLGGTDTTLTSVRVTAAAGSFTVTGNAAATGTVPFDFVVFN